MYIFVFQAVGRSSDLNRAVAGLSVRESCPSYTNEFEEFGLPLVTAGSVGSAVCRDVLCRTGVLLCSVLLLCHFWWPLESALLSSVLSGRLYKGNPVKP